MAAILVVVVGGAFLVSHSKDARASVAAAKRFLRSNQQVAAGFGHDMRITQPWNSTPGITVGSGPSVATVILNLSGHTTAAKVYVELEQAASDGWQVRRAVLQFPDGRNVDVSPSRPTP